jgi:DNA polymerase III alpha subunit
MAQWSVRMINVATDIDIDVPDRAKILKLFRHVPAKRIDNGSHASGVYFHAAPTEILSNKCVVNFKEAEEIGLFKIDILNVNIYNDVRDQAHMDSLLSTEPIWELLHEKDFCDIVFHMRGHHSVCATMQPTNVLQLAAVLAMIRPAKQYLIGKSWNTVFSEVWQKPADGAYAFKKSHSVSYATAVKLHMNLICEQL